MLKINPSRLIKFALLAVMITGCLPYTGANVITPSVGSTPSVVPITTVAPVPSIAPSITIQPPTISPTPKGTESPTTKVVCEPALPQAIATHGYLIATGQRHGRFAVFDLSSMKIDDRLSGKAMIDYSVYANALAYIENPSPNYEKIPPIVIVRDGNTETIPMQSGFWYVNWINNDTLRISSELSITGMYTLFLNTQTHEIRKLETKFEDYPLHLNEVARDGRWDFGIPYFNATQEFALYPGQGFEVKLIHVPDFKVLRTIGISPNYGIRWSPKGDTFVYVWPELTLASIDNREEVLTDFGKHFANFEIFSNYSWSPDGSKVAFWVTFDPYPGKSTAYLSFVDIATKIVKITCFLSHDLYDELSPIIWSPDSRQVAVKVMSQQNQTPTVYFMDTETFAYKALDYEDELYLGGWLSFRP